MNSNRALPDGYIIEGPFIYETIWNKEEKIPTGLIFGNFVFMGAIPEDSAFIESSFLLRNFFSKRVYILPFPSILNLSELFSSEAATAIEENALQEKIESHFFADKFIHGIEQLKNRAIDGHTPSMSMLSEIMHSYMHLHLEQKMRPNKYIQRYFKVNLSEQEIKTRYEASNLDLRRKKIIDDNLPDWRNFIGRDILPNDSDTDYIRYNHKKDRFESTLGVCSNPEHFIPFSQAIMIDRPIGSLVCYVDGKEEESVLVDHSGASFVKINCVNIDNIEFMSAMNDYKKYNP